MFSFSELISAPVSVRIFTTNIIKTFIFSPSQGSYNVYGDGVLLSECDASCIYQMSLENGVIHLKTFEADIGKFSSVKFITKIANASFKIKCITPASTVRNYDDDLEISVTSDKSQLLLINKVNIQSYISGVVQSESGKANNVEYYKMQAIICRTYLLAHLNRHETEGFQMCDDVHCQVFLSCATEKIVKDAVKSTSGLVIVDNELNLVTAAFHSNCGGYTCNSEDVWALEKTYLKAVKDSFCLAKKHAHWQREIALEDWRDYLKSKGVNLLDSSLLKADIFNFKQETGRALYYTAGNYKLPLKTIRNDFKLKSTYFSVEQKGNEILITGRGYGHGVGLCQEGAMEMSKKKYTYSDILHYYYKDINVIDLASLSYFKQD